MKQGMKVQVVGTIERVAQYTKGQVSTVAVTRDGGQFPDRVTVWGTADTQRLAVGQLVKVEGLLSWKVEEYNGKVRAVVSVNFPKVEVLDSVPAAGPVVDAFGELDPPF
jgi:hypothetical protein